MVSFVVRGECCGARRVLWCVVRVVVRGECCGRQRRDSERPVSGCRSEEAGYVIKTQCAAQTLSSTYARRLPVRCGAWRPSSPASPFTAHHELIRVSPWSCYIALPGPPLGLQHGLTKHRSLPRDVQRVLRRYRLFKVNFWVGDFHNGRQDGVIAPFVPGWREVGRTKPHFGAGLGGRELSKWLDHSPPSNANRVRFPAGSPQHFRMWQLCPDDAAGRRVFSGISGFPLPCIAALLHTHLGSLSLAFKTLILRTSPNLFTHTALLTARSSEPMRVIEVSMGQRRNGWGGEGETGDRREGPPTSGIVRHDSHLRKSVISKIERRAHGPTLGRGLVARGVVMRGIEKCKDGKVYEASVRQAEKL
ncbi:hypothetical protein PR048_028512 [Dryococelus australis]|uniref:Uncharacterized protein n=1 Tax=Dryococelus australis TaxID=614101 RepID=A0ABQ9GEM9_9NEOP|nr:hypothetical protein PR048_028512 [Dryococelus australis]